MTRIEKSTFQFLKRLAANNNREWFQQHRAVYEAANANILLFVTDLLEKMNVHDDIETPSAKKSLYRIYNDVRFSEDKTPYNPRFAGYLKRRKPWLRGGYYYWIKPGASRIGCGFVYPNSEDLQRIRLDIAANFDDWKRMLKAKKIIATFGQMQGNQVKTVPRGFSKDDPAIDLLRFKQYWFERSFSDQEVLAPGFLNTVDKTFQSIRPIFDYFSEVLSTNANGETTRK